MFYNLSLLHNKRVTDLLPYTNREYIYSILPDSVLIVRLLTQIYFTKQLKKTLSR